LRSEWPINGRGFATQHAILRNEVGYNGIVSSVTTREGCRSSTTSGFDPLQRAPRSTAWRAVPFAVVVTLAS